MCSSSRGRYLDICEEYNGAVDHVFYSADHLIAAVGSLVFRYTSQAERIQIFQDGDLSAEPDHGVSFRHVVLYIVFRRRADQLAAHADRIYRYAV